MGFAFRVNRVDFNHKVLNLLFVNLLYKAIIIYYFTNKICLLKK